MAHTVEIFPGYELTEEGKVYSTASNWRGYGRRELKQSPNFWGYMRVRLMVGGQRKSYFVHKLVVSNFLSPNPGGLQIRHLDDNKSNNSLSNLVWGTAKENASDREKNGRTSRGFLHSMKIKEGLLRRVS